jgi:hypothetical protein
MRFLVCDIRRLFSRKAMVVLCVMAPVIVMLLFASIVAPMMFVGRGLHFNMAILQEDSSLEVQAFIFQLLHSQSLADLVTMYPVDSLEKGMEMVERQEASILMHIPPGVMEELRNQHAVKVSIYSTPEHALELSLVSMTLGQSLMLVGQGQNQMEVAKQVIIDKGVPVQEADVFLQDMTYEALTQYLNRRRILGENGSLSPLGDYLPVEYYLAAIFAMFAAFAMLPLIHFTASDLSGSILRRGLACGRGYVQFYFSRLLSGTLFILLVLLMVFPTSLLLNLADQFIGSAYQGNLPALFLAILLTAFCLSTLAALLAAWIGKVQPAIWTGFYLALGMAVAGGALIPDQSLPGWVAAVGAFLPLHASMRGLASALFHFDSTLFWPDMLKMAGFTAVVLPLGLWGFIRKERGI